jgi:hypothetical protein
MIASPRDPEGPLRGTKLSDPKAKVRTVRSEAAPAVILSTVMLAPSRNCGEPLNSALRVCEAASADRLSEQ